MSLRTLFVMLVAVALLFAPSLTLAGEAVAALPDHSMLMMEQGHCTPPSGESEDEPASKSCCVAISVAVAIAPWTPADGRLPRQLQDATFAADGHRGHLGEIATPPPRLG